MGSICPVGSFAPLVDVFFLVNNRILLGVVISTLLVGENKIRERKKEKGTKMKHATSIHPHIFPRRSFS